MNESTLTQLKTLVERAVRPVRASMSRKRRMREELLAHVSAVFEEEEARLGDEQAALERTAPRFGNPAELVGQLQQSVPARDSIRLFVEQLFYRHGESLFLCAVRHALLLAGVVLLVLLITALPMLGGRGGEWPTETLLFGGSLLLRFFFGAFSFTFLLHCMRQAFGPTGYSLMKVAVVAVASSVVVAAFFLLPDLGSGQVLSGVWSKPNCMAMILLLMVVTPCWLAALGRDAAASIRYHQEWAALQTN